MSILCADPAPASAGAARFVEAVPGGRSVACPPAAPARCPAVTDQPTVIAFSSAAWTSMRRGFAASDTGTEIDSTPFS